MAAAKPAAKPAARSAAKSAARSAARSALKRATGPARAHPSPKARYKGPLPLARSRSLLAIATLATSRFVPSGWTDNFVERDLGLAGATDGRAGARHTRAIKPFERDTGWHWHDMDGHFVYVLRGWIRFRYAGVKKAVTVKAGSCLSQPAGVAHNVVGYSDDVELIEINLPAIYATIDLPEPAAKRKRRAAKRA
ncbi:MAG: cupin domain-containing protein [Alphaproteobacteria bacterium]|nr:cupin domain-containing protein [Alphaproteobacteria bacterium]